MAGLAFCGLCAALPRSRTVLQRPGRGLPSVRVRGPATTRRPICLSAARRAPPSEAWDAPPPPTPKAGAGSKKRVGAHVSIQGGFGAAVERAAAIGARSMAFFTRNQRRWASPPLAEGEAAAFAAACGRHGYDPGRDVVAHGIYLLNPASADGEVARKSSAGVLDDVQRCGRLGVGQWNFHPGTAGGAGRGLAAGRVARAVDAALQRSEGVSVLLENAAGEGSKLGATFEELAAILDAVEGDRSRVGVCLDTCHLHAAGYDIETRAGYEATMDEFGRTVGWGYLKAIHVNDSQGPRGCRRDRHESIGLGALGLDPFRWLMSDPRLDGLPLVLETPTADQAAEVALLYALEGADDRTVARLQEGLRAAA